MAATVTVTASYTTSGDTTDADPLTADQTPFGQPLQHPGEDHVVHLERQPAAGAAQP